jgi:hypothetical protein
MDIEELLKARVEQGRTEKPEKEKPEPPKSYYPSQCSSALLREIIRRSNDHKDDKEVQMILRSIKSRTKILGGDERLRAIVERLRGSSGSNLSSVLTGSPILTGSSDLKNESSTSSS